MSWLPKKKVIVPVDFSDDSFEAVSEAAKMVATPEDLIVVHVLAELSPAEPGVAWGEIDDNSRREHTVKAIEKRLTEMKFEAADVRVEIGSAAHEVANLANRESAELIVVSSHGRTGAKHFFIGSVAEQIVRFSHCPVLVLRK